LLAVSFCNAQFTGGNGSGHSMLNQVNTTCSYGSSNPYTGGNADGSANTRRTNISCSYVVNNPFYGGTGDGHAAINITNTVCSITSTSVFAGGIADGHSNTRLSNIACTYASTNVFVGGIADGHANSRINNIACSYISTNPFAGGIADGHSNWRITNITCPVISLNPFYGGFADGHSNRRITNVSCSTTPSSPYIGGRNSLYLNKFDIPCSNSVLPVELLRFNAKPEGDKVVVTWTTASESNSDYFSVERSKDGSYFSQFDIVRGAGNSNKIIDYKTYDYHPASGDSYYRLRQTDFNGDYRYSNIVQVHMSDEMNCRIYPNPSSGQKIFITITGRRKMQLEVKLFDANGMIIFSNHHIFDKDGESTFPLTPSAQLQSGVYMVVISTDDKTINRKLVVE
jgi:hypothetical protein